MARRLSRNKDKDGLSAGDGKHETNQDKSRWIGTPYHKMKAQAFYQELMIGGEVFAQGDCVLVLSDDPATPYVARIERLFEDVRHEKKFRGRWFFRKQDDSALKHKTNVLENELFLSDCTDVNSIDSIIKKCTVVYQSPELGSNKREVLKNRKDKFICRYFFKPQTKGKLLPLTPEWLQTPPPPKVDQPLPEHIEPSRASPVDAQEGNLRVGDSSQSSRRPGRSVLTEEGMSKASARIPAVSGPSPKQGPAVGEKRKAQSLPDSQQRLDIKGKSASESRAISTPSADAAKRARFTSHPSTASSSKQDSTKKASGATEKRPKAIPATIQQPISVSPVPERNAAAEGQGQQKSSNTTSTSNGSDRPSGAASASKDTSSEHTLSIAAPRGALNIEPSVSSPPLSPRLWVRKEEEEVAPEVTQPTRSKRASTSASTKSSYNLLQQRHLEAEQEPVPETRIGPDYQAELPSLLPTKPKPPTGKDLSLIWSAEEGEKLSPSEDVSRYLHAAGLRRKFLEGQYVWGVFNGEETGTGIVTAIRSEGSSVKLTIKSMYPVFGRLYGEIDSSQVARTLPEVEALEFLHTRGYDISKALAELPPDILDNSKELQINLLRTKKKPVEGDIIGLKGMDQGAPRSQKRRRPESSGSSGSRREPRSRVPTPVREAPPSEVVPQHVRSPVKPTPTVVETNPAKDPSVDDGSTDVAKQYLNRVKKRLGDHRFLYKQFLYTLRDFDNGILTLELLFLRVRRLLDDYDDLLLEFQEFFPSPTAV